MIIYTTGNIFESDVDCLVNTVNCEGYMGKGIAYQFKLNYPENNKDYVRACKSGELRIGTIHSFNEDGKIIVNFPTKNKWREKSQMHYVEDGLDLLVKFIKEKEVASIAIPPLGCGNGGLKWNEVKTVIERKLSNISNDCKIIVYEPSKAYIGVTKEAPKLGVSSLAILKIKMKLDHVGKTRLQKTAFFVNYFMNLEYFKFDKWKYGPYSHSVSVISRSIGEYQNYYSLKDAESTYNHIFNIICSKKTEEKLAKLLPAIDEATSYVSKIDSNKRLEGITMVLYLIEKNENTDKDTIVKLFNQWSEDNAARFADDYIAECVRYLENTGIIYKNLCGIYELNDMV